MSALREAIADWLRDCADRVHRRQPAATAAAGDLDIPQFPDRPVPHIPPAPSAPPAFVTPEQIRAEHNRRLLRQEALGREGVVRIQHLGRVS